MSRRTAGLIAWSLCGLALGLHAAGSVLTAIGPDPFAPTELLLAVPLLGLSVVGALVAVRQPGNAIGWLFSGAGLLLAMSGTSYAYADYALAQDGGLPGGVAAAWLTSWVFLPALFGIPPLLFLLFPDGRPLGRRWRVAVAVTVFSLICQSVAAAFRPGPLQDAPTALANPVTLGPSVWLGTVELVGWTLGLLSIIVAAWSLVLRYRRSRGHERLQLRWFVSSAVLFGVGVLVSSLLFTNTRLAGLGQAIVFTTFMTIPIASGVAILRYRLYDIDVVINRTLVYGSLTAILAGTYLGSVLLLQLVLNPLENQSDLAVAGSTLAVAALFGPARSRIQALVDRRFFRSRYDAGRTLDAFAAHLRHEVDLDAVGADLRAAVRDTVQPAHVSLWLRTRGGTS